MGVFLLCFCLIFLTLKLLLDLCFGLETPPMKLLILFYLLPELLLSNNPLHKLLMLGGNTESREYFHHVIDLFL